MQDNITNIKILAGLILMLILFTIGIAIFIFFGAFLIGACIYLFPLFIVLKLINLNNGNNLAK